VFAYANVGRLKVKRRKCQDRGSETHPKTLAQLLAQWFDSNGYCTHRH